MYLYPGEYHFATRPTLIHTILGSCVSVVLYDEIYKYGAMCHAVTDTDSGENKAKDCFRYIDCVLYEMISKFAEFNVPPKRLTVKMFGGARLLKSRNSDKSIHPGNKNILMAKEILREHGCKIAAEDSGGEQGRKIYFCSHTGEVFLKRIKKNMPV